MKLFGKRRLTGRVPVKLGAEVRNSIERHQRQIADYMARKTQYWNRASKLIALVLFCMVFGGFCLWLLCNALV